MTDDDATSLAPPPAAPAPAPASPPPRTAGQALARAGLIVSIAFLASRFLGWIRFVVLGNAFDAAELDLFFAAFRIPDLIYQLVAAGALGSALIPIVSGLIATGEQARAWRVVSTVANLMLVALAVAAVALAVAPPLVVPAITPGFDVIQTARTVELTRIMLLSPVFLALGAVATSVLNSSGRFAAAAVAPIVYNAAIIAGALLLAPFMGIAGVAIGVIVGAFGHLLVQVRPMARLGFHYEPRIDLADEQARTALKLMGPRAIGLGASQITFVVVTSLASLLGPGAITAYNVAFTLLQVPMGLIGVPLGTVVFPSLSREVAIGRASEYAALVTRALRLLLYVMLPAAGLIAILRRQLVTVLFPRFEADLVELTANALLLFLIGLAAHALIAVLARAFYARQDTRTPVAAAILAVLANTTLAIVLVGPLGLGGIALAIAIAAWAEALVLLFLLERRVAHLQVGHIARVALEAALGTLVAGAVGLLVLYTIDSYIGPDPGLLALVAQGALVTVAFGLVYLGLSVLLRIPELPSIVGVVRDMIQRRGR